MNKVIFSTFLFFSFAFPALSEETSASEPIPFTRIEQGKGDRLSGGDAGAEAIIKDPQIWRIFWDSHTADRDPRPALPDVDFNAEMIIVSSLGEVSGVYMDSDQAVLRVVVADMDKLDHPSETSKPFHIIRAERLEFQSVVFEHQGASNDPLSEVERRKPVEFNTTVDKLTPYVDQHRDGSITIEVPADVIESLDQESYQAILGGLEQYNQMVTGVSSKATAERRLPPIPWGKIYALVKRWGKWVWYKVHLCMAEVVRHWDDIISGSPDPRDWIYQAAYYCAKGMR